MVVIYPATRLGCSVPADCDVYQCRAAKVIVDSSTVIFGISGSISTVCISGCYRKAIQYRRAIRAATSDDVIGVIARIIQSADVTAQDRGIACRVALREQSLCAGKTSIDDHAILKSKGGSAVYPSRRFVHSRSHPDLVTAYSRSKRGL